MFMPKIPLIDWNLIPFFLPHRARVLYDNGTLVIIKRIPSDCAVLHRRNTIEAYIFDPHMSTEDPFLPQNVVPFEGEKAKAIFMKTANDEGKWYPVTTCMKVDFCPVVQSDTGCAPTACLWRDFLYTVGPPYPSGADPIPT